jgi:serine protease Do
LIVMTRALRLLASAALIIAMPAAPAFAQEADRSFQFAAPADAPQTFADLIAAVSPAVVSIEASGTVEPGDAPDLSQVPPQFRDFFERFGGGPQQPRERRSQGSGFFISADGFLVTNNHVIDEAEDITVALSDGRRLPAEVIGTDPATDLAVLRVNEGAPFDFVTLDPNMDVRVGDWVVAVGNPFGLGGTATTGIISATGRQVGPGQAYTDFIQTDAAINRGNSGGPMFDLNGHVIGVNSAIISPTGGNVGIGFAIPSDLAANVVNQLIEAGEVQRGYLGVATGRSHR